MSVDQKLKTLQPRNQGELVSLRDFEEWSLTGKIAGVGYDAATIFYAIQSRAWVCPECGPDSRIEHSLDATIEVGNPICPEGHDMELAEEGRAIDIFEVGDQVEVDASKDPDINHDFVGTVAGFCFEDHLVSVRDQDDNVFDININAVTAAE